MLVPTQSALDFETDAYYLGDKVSIKLSNFCKKWVVLVFYSSDFTFV